MHTAIPVAIGKNLLILATVGEEVIGDVIMVMVKDGLPAVGEDDQLITPCAEQVLIFRCPLQHEFAKPANSSGFFIFTRLQPGKRRYKFPSVFFSRHGFRLICITFLFLLNNF
jgi:hypothetical protein